MTESQQRALVTLALLAAHADGFNADAERAAIARAADAFAGTGIDVAAIEREIEDGRIRLADVAKALDTEEVRKLAYETAVGIAGADGARTPGEDAFLGRLATALALPAAVTQSFTTKADAVEAAALPVPAGSPTRAAPDAAGLDQRIVDAAITNAALELLPESLASMAIIPLQMRLVYRIGQAYGYELDQSHVKDFVATLGVGLAGQYLEQYGRKLLGGILGGLLGGLGRSVGRQAASSGMAFATTWAIGQVAKQYYAGGRTLDAEKLKAAFAPLLAQAQTLGGSYADAIRERARSIDLAKLPALIRKS